MKEKKMLTPERVCTPRVYRGQFGQDSGKLLAFFFSRHVLGEARPTGDTRTANLQQLLNLMYHILVAM